jgi:subtilisin family serine protease
MKKSVGVLVFLAILLALILGGCGLPPLSMGPAQPPDPSSKISPLLALQVEAKTQLALEPLAQTGAEAERIDTLAIATGMRTEDLTCQRIFIHFEQEPTQSQLAELQGLGITAYADSWIPPVGDHPTGFILADMPIDKLNELAAKNYVISLNTAEQVLEPANDLAAMAINADDVWDLGYDGSGIRIAVLDTGLDVTHPDISTPIASRDYSNYPRLGNTIADTDEGHGTHVTGCALGRGTQSGGRYKGEAPGADLIFLKIAGEDGKATDAAIAGAIKAAVDTYHADIINISFGGWSQHHDGTDECCQAADYAFRKGVAVFAGAGNEAANARHYSGTAPANGSTDFIRVNVSGAGSSDIDLTFNLVWFDGPTISNDLTLEYYDANKNRVTDVTILNRSESTRGTEQRYSYLDGWVPSGYSTWYIKVRNNSATAQVFHIYDFLGGGRVTFQNPDPFYTIISPAEADNAIAVGAYVTRPTWISYKGALGYYEAIPGVGYLCYFSSWGPRVDSGAPPKPNVVAPGQGIISCRDQDTLPWSGPHTDELCIIDNDGFNLNGSGPADYYVMEGTSMAAPHAAGAAALLLQAYPWLKGNPAALRDVLQGTATNRGVHYEDNGYGGINVLAAYTALIPEYDLTISSTGGGSVTNPGEGTFTYDEGTMVNLKTVAERGYRFVSWTGDVDQIANVDAATTTITIYDDYAITANFMKTYTLTVASTTGGSVTNPGKGTFTYDEGTIVNLVAEAGQGYRFVNWTGDVDQIANVDAATTTIIMNHDCSIRANFIARYDLTIDSTAGGSVTGPGEGTFTYDSGTVVNLKAVAEQGYRFVSWTGDVHDVADVHATDTTITMKGSCTITANFVARYDLTIHSTAGGSVTGPGEGTFTYDDGTVVNLKAEAEQGYRFVNWTGNVDDIADVQAATTTIIVKGKSAITANFAELPQYHLTVSSTAGGSVTSPGEGTFIYYEGTVVNLVTESEDGYRLAIWSGDVDDVANVRAAATTITIKGDSAITANFEEIPQYDLTVNSTAGGSVTDPGEGTFTYYEGTVVGLIAEPEEGYRLANWTGDVGHIANVRAAATTITIMGNSTIVANFEEIPQYDLAVSSTAGGSVTGPGEGTFIYDDGTVVNLKAVADQGYRFVNWTGDVDDVADVQAATTTITIRGNSTITANFMVQYDLTIDSTDGGSVSEPGEGTFACDEGTVVNLVAEAEDGYRFVDWTGDVDTIADVEDAATNITMDDDYSITANFEEKPSGGICFVATAAYGTPMAEEVEILREFRDEYLLMNPLGQALVGLYYRVSPPIADFITEHPGLKPVVRAGLLPAVALSGVAVNTSPVHNIAAVGLLALVSAALAIWLTRRRGRRRKYTWE